MGKARRFSIRCGKRDFLTAIENARLGWWRSWPRDPLPATRLDLDVHRNLGGDPGVKKKRMRPRGDRSSSSMISPVARRKA
jgi:hypothetical protein